MNVFRLIDSGRVDKIIAFDSLPKRLLNGIRTKDLEGFPRYWRSWLKDNGSVQTVERWDAENMKSKHVEETFTYLLNYKDVNQDIEKWQAICNYIRKAVDLTVRLMDRIEDMAIPLAKDAISELSIEPEQVPIIPVPLELAERPEAPRIIRSTEEAIAEVEVAPKKRGRPKKEVAVVV